MVLAQKRKMPQRMCIGCREMKAKKSLTRVVRTPEGEVEVDDTGKKAGRGAYICSTDCLAKAIKGKGLEKSLQKALPEHIINLLKEKLKEKQGTE